MTSRFWVPSDGLSQVSEMANADDEITAAATSVQTWSVTHMLCCSVLHVHLWSLITQGDILYILRDFRGPSPPWRASGDHHTLGWIWELWLPAKQGWLTHGCFNFFFFLVLNCVSFFLSQESIALWNCRRVQVLVWRLSCQSLHCFLLPWGVLSLVSHTISYRGGTCLEEFMSDCFKRRALLNWYISWSCLKQIVSSVCFSK